MGQPFAPRLACGTCPHHLDCPTASSRRPISSPSHTLACGDVADGSHTEPCKSIHRLAARFRGRPAGHLYEEQHGMRVRMLPSASAASRKPDYGPLNM
ncbi:hypothetical protein CC85DRAFT_287616 [Cutaneotrichosporon oleaginosum]|uniref:Uncharacterized protein n=1 Tax=Cutaneotrichosporon oleaginosum TaxID=879819 RepID=A0A0J0XGY5_9TREE|nr:uncharacterized protein CC85DRAFT_287616 [Cutaneotrichosporon oleaginosum]KLT40297.1 hypothetical protein CC85DRAFT_287616 [Cutaneotrichosporon oleaginosum]TXT07990.1 hypothetical protein COLE_04914 [Cutaneotrichosporon oleaginosum]